MQEKSIVPGGYDADGREGEFAGGGVGGRRELETPLVGRERSAVVGLGVEQSDQEFAIFGDEVLVVLKQCCGVRDAFMFADDLEGGGEVAEFQVGRDVGEATPRSPPATSSKDGPTRWRSTAAL